MKKTFIAVMLVLAIVLVAVGSVSAQKGKVNVKGEVTAVGSDTLTVTSSKGDTYVFTVPSGFDMSAVQVGDAVLVKATPGEGDTWLAQTIKLVGQGDDDDSESKGGGDDDDDDGSKGKGGDDDDDGNEKPEGFKENSAFCAEGKQERPHPLAPKIAERYGVTEDLVMGYFCDGYSIGAIMLAIKTSQVEGMDVTPEDLLAGRRAGNGWGEMWKNLGLIGSEKSGHSPPGLLKKPDHAGPKK